MYFDCLHLKVVGNKGQWFLFTEYLIVLYHLRYVLWLFAYLFCVVGIKGRWFLFTEYLIVFHHLSYVLWLFAYLFCVVGIKGRYWRIGLELAYLWSFRTSWLYWKGYESRLDDITFYLYGTIESRNYLQVNKTIKRKFPDFCNFCKNISWKSFATDMYTGGIISLHFADFST